MIVTCLTCGKEFHQHSGRHVFCTKACRTNVQRQTVNLKCQQCGKAFQRFSYDLVNRTGRLPASAGKFCSRTCKNQGMLGVEHRVHKPKQENICPVCGIAFVVGGRTERKKGSKFCSRDCRDRGAFHKGAEAVDIAPLDAAYLAGIIDGEGSIMIYWRESGAFIKLQVTNTSMTLLNWLVTVTGVGNVHLHKRATETHHETHQWITTAAGAATVLAQIRPYLRVKPEQADLAMETYERLKVPALKADRTWQSEYRARMQLMNRRGPRDALPV